ncbi:hypothetical protein PIB30_032335 [Stylosanthes scabra]|uniref:Uncharacterized protein n=1 Tax=Stylosanthes scabra TaxID=79078 RepID=A0ABU6SC39_9FABA|nr:hypothetical protein [Stylosanthes scabra]
MVVLIQKNALIAQTESEFLKEFEHAEELSKAIEPGNTDTRCNGGEFPICPCFWGTWGYPEITFYNMGKVGALFS